METVFFQSSGLKPLRRSGSPSVPSPYLQDNSSERPAVADCGHMRAALHKTLNGCSHQINTDPETNHNVLLRLTCFFFQTSSQKHADSLILCIYVGHVSTCVVDEMALAEVALSILSLLMKEQWSWLCTENIQRAIRLLFGTLINR